jgi:hypothetical protein
MFVPGYMMCREPGPTKSWIQDEPKEIFNDPEQHDTSDDAGFEPERPLPDQEQRKMEDEQHEGKYPCVVASEGPPAPKDIKQPVVLDAKRNWKLRRPAITAFDLDFDIGEEKAEKRNARKK